MQARGPISRNRLPGKSPAISSACQRLRVEYWPVGKLKRYERNPRKNDQAVDRIRASIREYGFAVPIFAKSDGEVIDGDLRLKGAVAEKMREVPVVPCDGWTDAQVKAFRLMVNRSVTWAEWDSDLLGLELLDLKNLDFDLGLTGFDDEELAQLLAAQDATDGLCDEDAAPPAPQTPTSKVGDLWLLGRHRLLCGDSTDANCLLRAGFHETHVAGDGPALRRSV